MPESTVHWIYYTNFQFKMCDTFCCERASAAGEEAFGKPFCCVMDRSISIHFLVPCPVRPHGDERARAGKGELHIHNQVSIQMGAFSLLDCYLVYLSPHTIGTESDEGY